MTDNKVTTQLMDVVKSIQSGEMNPEGLTDFVSLIRENPDEAMKCGIVDVLPIAMANNLMRQETVFEAGFEILLRIQIVSKALDAIRCKDIAELDRIVATPEFIAVMQQLLATTLLHNCLWVHPEAEKMISRWRRVVLRAAVISPIPKTLVTGLSAVAALARNCYLNEYVYFEPADETTWVAILKAAIECDSVEGKPLDAVMLASYGCYRPLQELKVLQRFDRLEDFDDPAMQGLIQSQIVEPARIEEIKHSISQITPINDQTSKSVRDQYEENPYPRWTAYIRLRPLPFDKALKKYFPAANPKIVQSSSKPRIMIAGCGTGQQVFETASRFESASITAVDLSRTSLAYAKFKSDDYGLQDIEYTVADILQLPDYPELLNKFDMIESTGCLHHMSDPLAGMRALMACLKPGGIMRVALYSRLARSYLVPVRRFIAERGFKPTRDSIRKFRQFILDAFANSQDLPFLPGILTRHSDFYSVSMCRDLVFHVQEITFTPLEVAALVKDAGIGNLGFHLNSEDYWQAYINLFPDDPYVCNPKNISVFESKYPSAFLGLYSFYAQKP